jgi:hypothetical protein
VEGDVAAGAAKHCDHGRDSASAQVVHFPFSILDLIFVIARDDPDSMFDDHWAISGAMTNIKSKIENGKCSSFLLLGRL